ncbi:hypothetical protein ACFSBT_17565 [Halomarina rubra]|uniref:C2H2-type domain-containing protein n=2 Tax=Halomarina rubra TaxID=2071873 RepID=A0ABD6AZR0_9EURY
MARYRLYCPDCGAEGTTSDRWTLDELLVMHEDNHPRHAPDYETLEVRQ